jgi:hypothetical protein
MQRDFTIRSLVLAAAVLAVAACQKAPETASTPDASTASTTSGTSGTQAAQAPVASAPPAAPLPKVEVCKLLSAAEVGAIMSKPILQDGCTYALDPAAKEKALAEAQNQQAQATKRAQAGDMNGFMKGMTQAGMGGAGEAMKDQLTLTVEAVRDDQTEDQIKQIFAQTGSTVRGAMAPVTPGNQQETLKTVIQGLDEVSNVGDWAFTTNVASVNMGAGFSVRGRILEARKGPWHVTVGATIAPDPGTAKLDDELANVARALIAKL